MRASATSIRLASVQLVGIDTGNPQRPIIGSANDARCDACYGIVGIAEWAGAAAATAVMVVLIVELVVIATDDRFVHN